MYTKVAAQNGVGLNFDLSQPQGNYTCYFGAGYNIIFTLHCANVGNVTCIKGTQFPRWEMPTEFLYLFYQPLFNTYNLKVMSAKTMFSVADYFSVKLFIFTWFLNHHVKFFRCNDQQLKSCKIMLKLLKSSPKWAYGAWIAIYERQLQWIDFRHTR